LSALLILSFNGGGDFEVRTLDGKTADVKLTLSPDTSRKTFADVSEVAHFNDDSSYIVPKASNFESVDSMMKPNLLFQMTVSATHPCKQAGLHRAIVSLKGGQPSPLKKVKGSSGQSQAVHQGPPPRLYFVVPEDSFDAFKEQSYTDSKGKIMGKSTYADVNSIEQFVLKVSLT
jgi:hypothetical protein